MAAHHRPRASLGVRPVAGRVLAALAFCFALISARAEATAVSEAPWRPEAAAYRATLFMLNLRPVPWDEIRDTWAKPYPGAAIAAPARSAIAATAGADAAAAIDRAVRAKDAPETFAAVSRALVAAIAHHLAQASARLARREAAGQVLAARALFRAVEDGVAAADTEGARRIGLAWLDLTTSAGTRGVLGAGVKDADARRFTAARDDILRYLKVNYAPSTFAPRVKYLPVPDHRSGATMAAWLPPGSYRGDQTPLPRLLLRFEAQGIDEKDLPLVAYGDMLFDSPEIYGKPAKTLGITCSMCHNRGDVNRQLYFHGISARPGGLDVDSSFFNPLFNDRRKDHVDTPSLRGLRFTAPYGRAGRFSSIRAFVRNVIVAEFGGPEPTPFMLDALVAYVLEFDFLPNSKITADGRLTKKAPPAARRGAVIFRTKYAGMGNRACADCHVPSSYFVDRRIHDIGSAKGYKGDISGGFDTPTLLGARFTAPYFHDGSQPTLGAVVAWKNRRHGLGLSDKDRADLTAYLDAVGDADEPWEKFDKKNTPFRLVFDELTTFASTLDMLLPRRDAKHALILIDTVAKDMAGDAPGMGNLASKPAIYALSEQLGAVGTAIRRGDWKAAENAWLAYKRLHATIDSKVY